MLDDVAHVWICTAGHWYRSHWRGSLFLERCGCPHDIRVRQQGGHFQELFE